MEKEEGTAGRTVAFVKAWKCERAWIIWETKRDWAWLRCQGSRGNSRRYDR